MGNNFSIGENLLHSNIPIDLLEHGSLYIGMTFSNCLHKRNNLSSIFNIFWTLHITDEEKMTQSSFLVLLRFSNAIRMVNIFIIKVEYCNIGLLNTLHGNGPLE